MFEVIQKIHEKPKVRYETFRRNFDYYCIQLQPNIKTKSFEKFKRKLLKGILANEKVSIEDEGGSEDYEKDYGEERWFQFSLFHLGEEKFMEELERLYCTPLVGRWTDYYIELCPHYIGSAPHYAHLRFQKTPSVAELLYAHSKVWKDFYRGIKRIDHYYDGLHLRGDNYTLVVEPFMSS